MIKKSKYNGVVVSCDAYKDTLNNLEDFGLDVMFSYENKNVLNHLKYHADMQLANIDDSVYVCAPECYDYYSNILKVFNKCIIKGNTFLSCNYPMDIAYNIIVTGKYAIHNFKYTDSIIKDYIKQKKMINVSQGYCACTLCVLGDKAFITSDRGLYKMLTSNKIDVLLTDDSSVLLSGFDHGFLGGASMMISDDLLAVNGKIENHPDYNNIKSFCSNYGISVYSLSNSPVMDVGSFILI